MSRHATPFNFVLHLEGCTGVTSARLTQAITATIAEGQISDGDHMPSTRTLAASLGVSRSVVVAAYEELTAAGFFVSKPGSSTVVEKGATAASRAGAASSLQAVEPETEPPIREARPTIGLDLRPGISDPSLIRTREWNRAVREAAPLVLARDEVTSELGSSRVRTVHEELRRRLVGHLRTSRGMRVNPDDLFIFPSVASALVMVASVCGLVASVVAYEDPGYENARTALLDVGVQVRPVPVDEEGINAADLRSSDRAVYVTPAHQFPLGGRMPVDRRAALLEWAAGHGALIIEDDYDGEFRYDVPPMPPLRSMGMGAEHVIYLGATSKLLTRRLRVSWVVMPERFRAGTESWLFRTGDTVSELATAVLTRLLASGALARHQVHAMRTYSARHSRFVSACEMLIPGVRALGIEAGVHVVLALDEPFDDRGVVADLRKAGLWCNALSSYYVSPQGGRTGLVCGYSNLPETKAFHAAELISTALSARLGTGRPPVRSVR